MLQHTPSWISQCLLVCGLGAEGPVQSNHCERRSRQVRLSRVSLCSKRLVSTEIAHVHPECHVRQAFAAHVAPPVWSERESALLPVSAQGFYSPNVLGFVRYSKVKSKPDSLSDHPGTD